MAETMSGRRFLCNTGIWQGGNEPSREAANGSKIQTFGEWQIVLPQATVHVQFRHGESGEPPADCTKGLLVDIQNRHLVVYKDWVSLPSFFSGLSTTTLVSALLESSLTASCTGLVTAVTKVRVEHQLQRTGRLSRPAT